MAEGRGPGEGEGERGQQRRPDGNGEGAEEDAGNSRDRDQRKEDHDRGDGRADQRGADLADGAADRFGARLAGVAVQHDVLHHHDGVVDDQPDGRGQAAEGHQVEGLVQQAERDEGDRDGDRDDEPRDQRRAPVAQEQHHDAGGEDQADQDGVAHAVDGFVDEFGLVVEGPQLDGLGELAADARRSRGGSRWPRSRCCCPAGGTR